MKTLVLTIGALYAIGGVAPACIEHATLHTPVSWSWTIAFAVLTQLAAAWAGAELLGAIRPLRMLVTRGAMARRAAAGVTAAGVGALLGSVGVALLPPQWSSVLVQVLTLGLGSLVGTICVLACCARVRPERCLHCGYDLSCLTVASRGVCPECGHDPALTLLRAAG